MRPAAVRTRVARAEPEVARYARAPAGLVTRTQLHGMRESFECPMPWSITLVRPAGSRAPPSDPIRRGAASRPTGSAQLRRTVRTSMVSRVWNMKAQTCAARFARIIFVGVSVRLSTISFLFLVSSAVLGGGGIVTRNRTSAGAFLWHEGWRTG